MQCPIDGTQLILAERTGVEIDYCPQCRGVWLDRGELDKIIDRAAGTARHRRPLRIMEAVGIRTGAIRTMGNPAEKAWRISGRPLRLLSLWVEAGPCGG